MFIGEYHHSLDNKGRIIIPSKFRYELGEKFVVTRGLDKCLFIYSISDWDKVVSRLKSLPFTKKDARDFMRFFLSGASICEFDKQGRITLTSPLVSYAGLDKDIVIIGVNDRLELWAESEFNSFLSNNENKLAEIAENLFSIGDFDETL